MSEIPPHHMIMGVDLYWQNAGAGPRWQGTVPEQLPQAPSWARAIDEFADRGDAAQMNTVRRSYTESQLYTNVSIEDLPDGVLLQELPPYPRIVRLMIDERHTGARLPTILREPDSNTFDLRASAIEAAMNSPQLPMEPYARYMVPETGQLLVRRLVYGRRSFSGRQIAGTAGNAAVYTGGFSEPTVFIPGLARVGRVYARTDRGTGTRREVKVTRASHISLTPRS